MAAITQLRPWGFAGGGARRKLVKAKRRKFVFENGITVWAVDEATARAFARVDPTPETAAPVATKQQKPEPIEPSRSVDVPEIAAPAPDLAAALERQAS